MGKDNRNIACRDLPPARRAGTGEKAMTHDFTLRENQLNTIWRLGFLTGVLFGMALGCVIAGLGVWIL
jgi:hypothetical protein